MRLLEEYTVGRTLGEGTFGVVLNCKKRSTGEELAVKIVDNVETPVEAIKKEAEMLQSMDHPNIVKFRGVYHERSFVCIVMDKYSGGDLTGGLLKHIEERGQISCFDVVHVAKQMGAGIQYLHNRHVIHRDVKGDNFLMDRKDMTDPQCTIVLTDFGTACSVQPDERLSSFVGTTNFWAPEFFDKNYGPKVDVWAMGVVMYGLVRGCFPFRDETATRTKEVKLKRVHPTCEEFIKKMLEKKEQQRYSSDAVMAHKWVAEKETEQPLV
jgi:serine/threonine protein kinase